MGDITTPLGWLEKYDEIILSLAEDNNWCSTTLAYFDPEAGEDPRSFIPAEGTRGDIDMGLPDDHYNEQGLAAVKMRRAALIAKWQANVREMAMYGLEEEEEKMPLEEVNAGLKLLGIKPLTVKTVFNGRITLELPFQTLAVITRFDENRLKEEIQDGVLAAITARFPGTELKDGCQVSIFADDYPSIEFPEEAEK